MYYNMKHNPIDKRVVSRQDVCVVQAMMACLVHVALGRWRAMADDLDAMGFLKDRIDRDDLAASLALEVTEVWPLAGSFGADSFLVDGSAQAGGALAERLADGRVRPELGLGQGLTFGKLARVSRFASHCTHTAVPRMYSPRASCLLGCSNHEGVARVLKLRGSC